MRSECFKSVPPRLNNLIKKDRHLQTLTSVAAAAAAEAENANCFK